MAEDLNSEIFGAINLGASVSLVGDVLLWSLGVILVLGIVYFLYYLMSFNNTLILRDATNGNKIVKKMKWKERRDKNNNIWLLTPFNKIKKPLPPSESIEITPKGKKWVEAWRGEDTETLIWVKDTFNYQNYKENYPEFQPLTTQERELLVNEISKSQQYNKRNLFDTIVQVSLIMAPIILIAIVGLTLGDITEALTSYATPLTSTLQSVGANFENAMETLSCVQTIDGGNVEIPN